MLESALKEQLKGGKPFSLHGNQILLYVYKHIVLLDLYGNKDEIRIWKF